jgi:hypothetical protein
MFSSLLGNYSDQGKMTETAKSPEAVLEKSDIGSVGGESDHAKGKFKCEIIYIYHWGMQWYIFQNHFVYK